MKPQRIQRKRTKGWRMPPNTVYVGRGSRWGNPFIVGVECIDKDGTDFIMSPERAVKWYREKLESRPYGKVVELLAPLKGKDLCCWCKLTDPCHADVLLELANNGD